MIDLNTFNSFLKILQWQRKKMKIHGYLSDTILYFCQQSWSSLSSSLQILFILYTILDILFFVTIKNRNLFYE